MSGIPISSLTSEVCGVCGDMLPWNEILGQSQGKYNKDGGAAFGRPTMLSMVSLVLALYFIQRQPITVDYRCQTTNGDPREKKGMARIQKTILCC